MFKVLLTIFPTKLKYKGEQVCVFVTPKIWILQIMQIFKAWSFKYFVNQSEYYYQIIFIPPSNLLFSHWCWSSFYLQTQLLMHKHSDPSHQWHCPPKFIKSIHPQKPPSWYLLCLSLPASKPFIPPHPTITADPDLSRLAIVSQHLSVVVYVVRNELFSLVEQQVGQSTL